jgi:hypothetical protein
MKNINLQINKKNRKYFACTHNGFEVKLVIDTTSENLSLGEHELLVEDISVRTKFGTDLIYKVVGEMKKEGKIVTLQSHCYNDWLVDSCRKLGGKWDAEASTWVFSPLVEQEVDELDRLFNDDLIVIDIEALDDITSYTSPVTFMGYTVARAFGRSSGAKIGAAVKQLDGSISSGGSAKNWFTQVTKGSRFRLEISKNLLAERELPKNWKIVEK